MSLILSSLYKITKNNNFKSNGLAFIAVFIFFANQQNELDYVIERFSDNFTVPFNLFFLLTLCTILQIINYLSDEFFSKSIKNIVSTGFSKNNYIASIFVCNGVYAFCITFLFFFIPFIINSIMLSQNYSIIIPYLYELLIKLFYLFLYVLAYASVVTALFFIFKNKTISTLITILLYILEIIISDKSYTKPTSLGTPFSNLIKICHLTLNQLVTFSSSLYLVAMPIIIIATAMIITIIVFNKRDTEFYT